MEETPRVTASKPRDICLIGISAGGKGRLVRQLEAEYAVSRGLPQFISVGDVARSLSAETRATGALAPSFQLAQKLHGMVEGYHGASLLDGFPRYMEQLVWARRILNDPVFVWVDCPVLEAIERMVGRGREDDTDEGIAGRIQMYRDLVRPVIEVLQESHCLIHYPASAEEDPVDQQALRSRILRTARWS